MEKHEPAQVATSRWNLRVITRINGTKERGKVNAVPVSRKRWRKKRNSRPPPNKPNCKPLEKRLPKGNVADILKAESELSALEAEQVTGLKPVKMGRGGGGRGRGRSSGGSGRGGGRGRK
jgi:hypothetical protein